MSVAERMGIDRDALARLCREWRVRRLEAFGSVLRDDFRDDSGIDLLVSFDDGAPWSLNDLVRMERELSQLRGRPVDLVWMRTSSTCFSRHRMPVASVLG